MLDHLQPAGYQLLVSIYQPPKNKDNSQWETTDRKRARDLMEMTIGKVLKLGRDAYADPKRFPNGAWIKEGEWGVFRASEREQIRLDGQEVAFINDDRLYCVITNENVLPMLQTNFDKFAEYGA